MQPRDLNVHILGKERNPGQRCRNIHRACGGPRAAEVGFDDGIQSRIERFDSFDCSFGEFWRRDFSAMDELGQTHGVERHIFFRLHGDEVAASLPPALARRLLSRLIEGLTGNLSLDGL
jgi:hypothetical protein